VCLSPCPSRLVGRVAIIEDGRGGGSGASGVFEVCITVLPPTHIDSLAGRLVMQPVTRGKKSLLRDLGESAGSRC
jgi:hypothetical protein